jgi:hypothetical protein
MMMFIQVLPQLLRLPDPFVYESALAPASAIPFFVLTMPYEIDSHGFLLRNRFCLVIFKYRYRIKVLSYFILMSDYKISTFTFIFLASP